jgi:hypothetical protein
MNIPSRTRSIRSGLAALLCLVATGSAAVTTWVEPTDAANGSSSVPTSTTYTSNLGIVFKTGSSGTFSMDWLRLSLTSGTSGAASFSVQLRNTDSETPYVGVAGTTLHASDTINFTRPTPINTPFDVTFTAADAPNLMGYTMQPNTAYALMINSASPSFALRRTQGYADGTTNGKYTVTYGFSVLDTFRNNTENYSNSAGSYPSFHIAFGANAPSAVPEPAGAGAALLLGSAGMALVRRRKR